MSKQYLLSHTSGPTDLLEANFADFDAAFDSIPNVIHDSEGKYYSKAEYPFQEEAYIIIGACMEVHKHLGPGFLESVYHEALCIELKERCIPFETEKLLSIYYKNIELSKKFKADILAYGHILIELKAFSGLIETHQSQIYNYLSASKKALGLLINFGMPSLQYKRYILSKNMKHIQK